MMHNFVATITLAVALVVPYIVGTRAYMGESKWMMVERNVGKWLKEDQRLLLKAIREPDKLLASASH
jgi:hypothetical protein